MKTNFSVLQKGLVSALRTWTSVTDSQTDMWAILGSIQPSPNWVEDVLVLGLRWALIITSLNLSIEEVSDEWNHYIIAGRRLIVNFLCKTIVINHPGSEYKSFLKKICYSKVWASHRYGFLVWHKCFWLQGTIMCI